MCVEFLFGDLNFDPYSLKLHDNLYLWTTAPMVCNSDLFVYLLLFYFVFFVLVLFFVPLNELFTFVGVN